MLGRSQARRSKAKGETKETNPSQREAEASAGRQRGSALSNSRPAENLEEAERRQRVSLKEEVRSPGGCTRGKGRAWARRVCRAEGPSSMRGLILFRVTLVFLYYPG